MASNLQITVVVNGRFHAFDYAAELYKKNRLHRLISTMPYTVAKKFGIGQEVYVGIPIFEFIKSGWRKIFKKELPVLLYARLFTQTALLFLPRNTDVVISFAGYSEEIFKSKKLKNAIKILDRGSTHTLTNVRLNKIAAEYHKINWKPHPDAFIKRELNEYAYADKILVPSNFVEQSFIENGIPNEKVVKIPYALSTTKFEGLIKSGNKNNFAVLFVGQISARKGIGVLVDAMKIVRYKIPQAELWLVGSFNKQIDKKMLNENWIKYFGLLKGQDLYDKYNQASVFCLLSFEEGLAIVLIEAVYCGLSIVASENTGAKDIILNGENYHIVPAGNPNIAAEKIIDLLLKNRKITDNSHNMTWLRFTEILLHKI